MKYDNNLAVIRNILTSFLDHYINLFSIVQHMRQNHKNLPQAQKIKILQNKYLNNLIEQDHRFIKKRTKPMLGFKSFRSAKITIAGIENIRMIQKGQIVGASNLVSTFENFKMLMAA